MSDLTTLLGEHGIGLVFVNVLLTQLGMPLPAIPTMVLAGALGAGGHLSVFGAVGCLTSAVLGFRLFRAIQHSGRLEEDDR